MPWCLKGSVVALALVLGACGGSQPGRLTRALLPRSVPPDISELQITRRDEPYPVSGRTVAELARAMREHAAATWPDPRAVGMTVAAVPVAGRCQEFSDGGGLRDATISLSLVVHLPEWQNRAGAPASLQRSWDRFLAALTRHEEGHVQIAIEHAKALRSDLSSLPLAESCEALNQRLQERVTHRQKLLDEAQSEYDARTEHGIKQGCVL